MRLCRMEPIPFLCMPIDALLVTIGLRGAGISLCPSLVESFLKVNL